MNAIPRETAKNVIRSLAPGAESTVQPRVLWVDTKTAADYLQLTVTALRQRRTAGKIPQYCYRLNLGRELRWDLDAIDRWLIKRGIG